MLPQSTSTTKVIPKSTPIISAVIAAAATSIGAISPLATGAQINYGLLLATFLVVFIATFLTSLYHLELPSGLQQAAITTLTAGLTAALAQHAHTAIAVPVAPAAVPAYTFPKPAPVAVVIPVAPEPAPQSPPPVPVAPETPPA